MEQGPSPQPLAAFRGRVIEEPTLRVVFCIVLRTISQHSCSGKKPQPQPAAAASERRALFVSFSGTKRKDSTADCRYTRQRSGKPTPPPLRGTSPYTGEALPVAHIPHRAQNLWKTLRVAALPSPAATPKETQNKHPHTVSGTGVKLSVVAVRHHSSILPNISKSSLSLMRVLRAGAWGFASGSRGAEANSRPGTPEFRGPLP